jgi:hypothetical protein
MVHTRGGLSSLAADGIYSLNLVEEEFCELRLYQILGSSLFTLRGMRLAQLAATVYDCPVT